LQFIPRTVTTTATAGYEIPEAFIFDGKELDGYWAMKYNIGE